MSLSEPTFFLSTTQNKRTMKQITFTDSQWSLLLNALTTLRVRRYNQWKEWCDNHSGFLLAGIEESHYQQFRDEYYDDYMAVAQLVNYCYANAYEVEGDEV